MDNQKVDGLERFYVENYTLYREFSDRIRNLVQNLIERDNIEIYKIVARTKTPEELLIDMSERGSPSSHGDIPDYVVVSTLLRFPEDVSKVERIISEEFFVDDARSVPSSTLDDPFRFGYPAACYTLSLSERRAELREWTKYKGLLFKLDVRTMLQEVWADVMPKVNLNVDISAKKKMERKLVRIAALLEEADEGFLSLYETSKGAFPVTEREEKKVTMRPEPPVVEASRVFTVEEFYNWFAERPELLEQWGGAALKAGFPVFVPTPDYLRTSFENLCAIFKAAEMDTLDEVGKFIDSLNENDMGIERLQSVCDAFEKNVSGWRVDAYSALFLLVLNVKWNLLRDKDLISLGVKKGSDRISGLVE